MTSFSSFRWPYFFLATGILSIALLVTWYLVEEHPEDFQLYHHLMATIDKNHASKAEAPYTAKQERQGIQKILLQHQGPHRLQMRLNASGARLIFDRHDHVMEIIEQMEDVTCCWQEEIYFRMADGREAVPQEDSRLLLRGGDPQEPMSWIALTTPGLVPMQAVTTLTADEAAYHYAGNKLVAKEVLVNRYKLQGHELAESLDSIQPFMSGDAEEVELILSANAPQLKVNRLKATFQSKSGREK